MARLFFSSVVCDVCGHGREFEILMDSSDKQEETTIDKHVELIRNGYIDCEHITDVTQTKVTLFVLQF